MSDPYVVLQMWKTLPLPDVSTGWHVLSWIGLAYTGLVLGWALWERWGMKP